MSYELGAEPPQCPPPQKTCFHRVENRLAHASTFSGWTW